jgi:hypothetical protein
MFMICKYYKGTITRNLIQKFDKIGNSREHYEKFNR